MDIGIGIASFIEKLRSTGMPEVTVRVRASATSWSKPGEGASTARISEELAAEAVVDGEGEGWMVSSRSSSSAISASSSAVWEVVLGDEQPVGITLGSDEAAKSETASICSTSGLGPGFKSDSGAGPVRYSR